jgi:hypothetical protein
MVLKAADVCPNRQNDLKRAKKAYFSVEILTQLSYIYQQQHGK